MAPHRFSRATTLLLAAGILAAANPVSLLAFSESYFGADIEHSGVVLFDCDGDGDLDIAEATDQSGQTSKVWRNDGGSPPTLTPMSGPETRLAKDVAVGDIDNDGDLDLIWYQDLFHVWKNNGACSFSTGDSDSSAVVENYLALGDLDNDGDLDMVVSVADSGDIWKNDGTGDFTLQSDSFATGSNGFGVQMGDFNNDGRLDIIFVYGSVAGWKIYRNNGNWSFTEFSGGADLDWFQVALGDMDNDGKLDFVVSDSDNAGANRLYRNTDPTNFTFEISWSTTPIKSNMVAVGDYNRDGLLDIVFGHDPATVPEKSQVFRATTAATGYVQAYVTSNVCSTRRLALGDIDGSDGTDGDGFLDIVYDNEDAGATCTDSRSVLAISTFTGTVDANPSPPQTLSYSQCGSTVTLKWQDGSDDETTDPDGLHYAIQVATGSLGTYSGKYVMSGVYGSPLMGNFFGTRRPSLNPPNQHNLSGLTVGTTYYWRIRTVDSGLRKSAWSAEEVFVAVSCPSQDADVPAAVTNLSALEGTNSQEIKLTWTAPGDDGVTGTVSQYILKIATFAFDGTDFNSHVNVKPITTFSPLPTILAAGNNQEMSVTGLTIGTTYFFALKSRDDVGNYSPIDINTSSGTKSDPVNTTQAHSLPKAGPGSPANFKFQTVYKSSVTANWNSVGGAATGYILQASTVSTIDSGTIYSSSTFDTAKTTLTVPSSPSLTLNTTYYLRAGTLWSGGTDYISTPYPSTVTLAVAPDTVSPTFSNVEKSSFTVHWASGTAGGGFNSTGTEYKVERSTSSNFDGSSDVTVSTRPTGNPPTYTWTGLGSNTQYYVQVRTVSHDGQESAWVQLGSTTTDNSSAGSLTLATDSTYNPPTGEGLVAGQEKLVAAITLDAAGEDFTFDQTFTLWFTAVGGAALASDFDGFHIYKENNASANGWDGSDLVMKSGGLGTVAATATYLPNQNNTLAAAGGAVTYYITVQANAAIAVQEGIRVSINAGDFSATGDTSSEVVYIQNTFTGNNIIRGGVAEPDTDDTLRIGLDRHTFYDGTDFWIFYIDANDDVVFKTSSDGQIFGSAAVVAAGTFNSLGIEADATNVYVTYADGTDTYVKKIPISTKTPGSPTTLTTDGDYQPQIIKDSGNILWRKSEER